MASRNFSRPTAVFCLTVGILNLAAWLLIITSGQVDDFQERVLSYLFHWISEFITAILLIYSGILFFSRTAYMRNILFIALGFLLLSIGGAFLFYLREFEPAMFVLSSVITGLTIIVIILNYKRMQDFIYLAFGSSIYALINILGDALTGHAFTSIIMSIPALLFLSLGLFLIATREITFRRIIPGDADEGKKNKQPGGA